MPRRRRTAAVKLDVVRLDVLLHCLGGFATDRVPYARALPERLWLQLDELAAMRRCPHLALVDLAERWDRSPRSFAVLVRRMRRRGYRPQYRML